MNGRKDGCLDAAHTKLVVGCGYLGRRVAQRWVQQGFNVVGVARHQQTARELTEFGITPVIADVTKEETLNALPPADTVLYCVSHDPSAGDPLADVVVQSLQAVLDAVAPTCQRFIYTSSTSVYGQSDGSWVDEDSACAPNGNSAKAVLAAEQCIQSHPIAGRSIILRLAGLYGAERIRRRIAYLNDDIHDQANDNFLNLIHVDDAALAVVAADANSPLPARFNVSDGSPLLLRDYFARLLHVRKSLHMASTNTPRPATGPPRSSSNKRVGNRRLLDTLHIRLAYPSFDVFLQAFQREAELDKATGG